MRHQNIFLLVFLLSAFCCSSQEISFRSLDFATALKEAKQSGKYLFIDNYTSWCAPCKKMDKEVFADQSVGALYNDKFICLKVDMEKGEGIELRKKFNIYEFPTLIFLDPAGQVVEKIAGGLDKDHFIRIGNEVLSGKSAFADISRQYQNGDRSIDLLMKYADLLKIAYDVKNIEVADEWFSQLDNKSKLGEEGMYILREYITGVGTSIRLNSYRFLMDHKMAYEKTFKKDSVNLLISQLLRKALQFTISGKDTVAFLETLAEAYRQEDLRSKQTAANWELIYYQRKDSSNFLRLAREFSNGYFKNSGADLMGIAWTIVEVFPSTANLQFALSNIDKAIKLDPKDPMNYEIRAKILVAQNKKSEAITFLEKSMQGLKKINADVSRLERLIKKLNAN